MLRLTGEDRQPQLFGGSGCGGPVPAGEISSTERGRGSDKIILRPKRREKPWCHPYCLTMRSRCSICAVQAGTLWALGGKRASILITGSGRFLDAKRSIVDSACNSAFDMVDYLS